ncbi:(d)CMP kinase [Tepidibacillus infernus]|uniref:(d)CMP kinase n=1 Tax=Tepidibacillus TaxID=1494427 RepID=UPI000852A5FB|nr:(d)CMP kinase [Tepidibacillus sp. HK-1]GBF11682.1 cytidylate kinase [Tepidibacillus sp. HK-1]
MKKISIAIDGPAGAGKSTVAKKVANELGFLYIDTGAMYRALTLKAINENIDLHDEDQLNQCLLRNPIQFEIDQHIQRVKIGTTDVTEAIRTPEITKQVSLVASHAKVRETMVELQRRLAKEGSVVMDGRDIGTNVLPNAELKIFLTASIEERAHRRYLEMTKNGYEIKLEQIVEEIELRDKKDQERTVAPLKQAKDAILIDTSQLSIEQVVNVILSLARERMRGEN